MSEPIQDGKDEKREGVFRSFGIKTSENEANIMENPSSIGDIIIVPGKMATTRG